MDRLVPQRFGIQGQTAIRPGSEPRQEGRLRQHEGHARVGQHELHPFVRIVRIDGHVGRIRLEDSIEPDDHFDGTFHRNADECVPPGTHRSQAMGELVGSLIQLPVCEPFPFEDQRRSIRTALRLLLEKIHQCLLERVVSPSVIPRRQDLVLLRRRQCGDLVDLAIDMANDLVQEMFQLSPDRLNRGPVIDAGLVGDLYADRLCGIDRHRQRIVRLIKNGNLRDPE